MLGLKVVKGSPGYQSMKQWSCDVCRWLFDDLLIDIKASSGVIKPYWTIDLIIFLNKTRLFLWVMHNKETLMLFCELSWLWWPADTVRHHISWSSLVQVMACCMNPSQFYCMIRKTSWSTFQNIFHGNVFDINHKNVYENYNFSKVPMR